MSQNLQKRPKKLLDQAREAIRWNTTPSARKKPNREVLRQPLEGNIDAIRAKRPKRLPTVLTKQEVHRVLNTMTGTSQLIARLMYGSGLRLMEAVRLRVKDLDFAQRQMVVCDGKGMKDRVYGGSQSAGLAPSSKSLPGLHNSFIESL